MQPVKTSMLVEFTGKTESLEKKSNLWPEEQTTGLNRYQILENVLAKCKDDYVAAKAKMKTLQPVLFVLRYVSNTHIVAYKQLNKINTTALNTLKSSLPQVPQVESRTNLVKPQSVLVEPSYEMKEIFPETECLSFREWKMPVPSNVLDQIFEKHKTIKKIVFPRFQEQLSTLKHLINHHSDLEFVLFESDFIIEKQLQQRLSYVIKVFQNLTEEEALKFFEMFRNNGKILLNVFLKLRKTKIQKEKFNIF